MPTIVPIGDKGSDQMYDKETEADQETDDEQDKTIDQLEGRIGMIQSESETTKGSDILLK